MNYFRNPIFMVNIIKTQGSADLFANTQINSLLFYLQMQTKRVLETAIKFMRKDRRIKLQINDIQLAAREIGHSQILLLPLPTFRGVKDGKIHLSKLVDTFNLSYRSEVNQLKGRWIYYKNTIIEGSQRGLIRKLRIECRDNLEKINKLPFNIISATERSHTITEQQFLYLLSLENELKRNNKNCQGRIQGRVSRHFHLYLQLIRNYPNQTGIKMLINLFNFNNHQITEKLILCALPKALEILMVYRGSWAQKVGNMIVQLVKKYHNYQPQLLNIFQTEKQGFSYLIKAIIFQASLGIEAVHINISILIYKLKIFSERGDQLAALCLRLLLQKAFEISAFQKQNTQVPLELCLSYFKQDNYLSCF